MKKNRTRQAPLSEVDKLRDMADLAAILGMPRDEAAVRIGEAVAELMPQVWRVANQNRALAIIILGMLAGEVIEGFRHKNAQREVVRLLREITEGAIDGYVARRGPRD